MEDIPGESDEDQFVGQLSFPRVISHQKLPLNLPLSCCVLVVVLWTKQAQFLVTVPLLILRKLPLTAAEELLEIIMRRYERASTMLTSNRPVEDWGKLLGDAAAVSAMLDRLLHHGHVLKCGPRSWRTKTDLPPQEAAG
jgi:hypothetical protein